ncbi:MAG: hypothetical protein OEY32_14445 [Candidatus Krumholzibacteria bacterium]|nr:hypothetical protein [Candidatus Krumholzibacteria bacterium]
MFSLRSPIFLIIATAAYALTPYAPPVLATWVGIPVVMGYCIVLPGVLLNRTARLRGGDPLDAAALAGATGLAFLLAMAFLWAVSGVSIDAFRMALPVVILTVAARSPRRDPTRTNPVHTSIRMRDKRLLVVLALLIVQPVIGVLLTGPSTEIKSDTIDHAGYVAEIARTGDPFPTTAFYLNPGRDGEDLRKALLHTIYGFTARHTGASPLDVLGAYGGFLLLMMTLAVYSASRSLLGRHRLAAAIAVVLFLVGTDWGVSSSMIRAAFYPNRFGTAFLLLFIASAMEYMHRGPRSAVRWCAVYAFAATAVHVQYGVLVAFAAAIIVLWRTCSPCTSLGEHLQRSFRVSAWAALGAAPFMLYRWLTAYQTNPLHEQVQSAMYLTDKWFVSDPFRLLHFLGPLGFAAIVCIVPLWRLRKSVPGVGYAIAALLTFLITQLVPFVATPLYGAIRYLAFRLDPLVPFYILPAFLLARRPHAPVARVVVAIALVAAVVPIFGHTAFSSKTLEAERRRSPDRWARGLYQLATALPPGSVVASDPVTSYMMSAFTPYYVVCTLDQHAPPNDTRVEERVNAARDIVSPYTSARDKDLLIRENLVSHVVINKALPPDLILNYWTLEPAAALKSLEMFHSLRYEFDARALDDGLTVFRWRHDERLSTLPRPVPRPVVAKLPATADSLGVRAGEAVLAGALLRGEGILSAGGELVLDLFWQRAGLSPPGTYVVTIRFDKKDLTLPFGGRPFPKVTRKLLEKVRGERYRFRADHMIQGGLFAPDVWDEGEIVEDDVRVQIPTDIAPGRYRVEATMRLVANQPNYYLRDYLYDDDSLSGVPIGEVTIQKW